MKKAIGRILTCLIVLSFTGNLFAENDQPVNIHGFISQGYLQSTRNDFITDSEDGTWQFNEFALNFSYTPIEKLLISLQLFARDLGSVGNDDINVDFAFADYRVWDMLGIRAGKMKNSSGLYGETRDVDMLRTCIFLPMSVYDELLRDSDNTIQGVGIYGYFNTKILGSINYQATLGTNNISPESATSDYLEWGFTNITSVEMDTTQSYALVYTDPTSVLRLGATAMFTELHLDATARDSEIWKFLGVSSGDPILYDLKNTEIYTGSAELSFKDLIFTYEVKYSKARDLAMYTQTSPNPLFTKPIDLYGYYFMLTYQVNDFLEVSAYRDEFFPDRYNRDGKPLDFGLTRLQHWMKKTAVSVKIEINPNWIMKVEGQYIDGAANLLYETDPLKRYWWLYAAKLTYNF